MHNSKYLLYIDILGFSNLVKEDSPKIERLFTIIDNLNMHKHFDFQTIVFSDTILCFNSGVPTTHDEYLVMYACEFVQNLLYRSADLGIQFRAILTYGEFFYEKLSHIEKYYGKALVEAHDKEKEINGIGLFIHKDILKYNTNFETVCFDKDLHFVYLMQCMESLLPYAHEIPLRNSVVQDVIDPSHIKLEVRVLETVKKNIDDTQLDSKIRGKYSLTYLLYQQRYGELIDVLEKNHFECNIISPDVDWESF
ncbi:MAG: hypothetical protein FWH27_00475 [Planctomycetaceae bacterium]|nr:hypothetical protein [Planctomycetaceae bacterium]